MIHLPYLDQKCVRGEGVVRRKRSLIQVLLHPRRKNPFHIANLIIRIICMYVFRAMWQKFTWARRQHPHKPVKKLNSQERTAIHQAKLWTLGHHALCICQVKSWMCYLFSLTHTHTHTLSLSLSLFPSLSPASSEHLIQRERELTLGWVKLGQLG